MSPRHDLYLDEFKVGDRFDSPAGYTFTEAAIIDFGLRFDPQAFHVDVEAANRTLSRVALVLVNLAVAGEVVSLVLMREAGRAWAGVWYRATLVLAVTVNWYDPASFASAATSIGTFTSFAPAGSVTSFTLSPFTSFGSVTATLYSPV